MALTSWMSNIRVLRLVDTLRDRAAGGNGFPAYTYLEDGEAQGGSLSWADLDRQARTIAAHLGAVTARGERALLLFPAGLDFVAAFFGCLYAGVVAVPAYPPRPNRGQPRLRAIVARLPPRGRPHQHGPVSEGRRAGRGDSGARRRPLAGDGRPRRRRGRRLARSWGRPGPSRLPAVHLRLDRAPEGGDGQPPQPDRTTSG